MMLCYVMHKKYYVTPVDRFSVGYLDVHIKLTIAQKQTVVSENVFKIL